MAPANPPDGRILRGLRAGTAPALVVVAALLAPLVTTAAAQGDASLVLPRDAATVSADAIRLRTRGAETSYVEGLGWLSGWPFPAPVVREDGRVAIAAEVADALGLPRLEGVRTGLNGATTRIVLDVPGASAAALEPLRGHGRLRPDAAHVLELPGVVVPDAVLLEREGLRIRAVPEDREGPARVHVQGPEAAFDVFPLANPARVVVDLAPPGVDAAAEPVPDPTGPTAEGQGPVAAPERSDVAPGVAYRAFTAPGADGPSRVHVVELDPAATDLRVVGTSGEGRSVSDWADGGVAAINAGYFDPGDFRAIGLRRIGGTLLSLPSRGRAVVGFGPAGTVVTRADARVRIHVGGRLAVDRTLGGGETLSLSRAEGTQVGTAREGVVALTGDGRVASNTIGPVRVPPGGTAVVYDPELRPLALLDPGERVSIAVTLEPSDLERAAWAVEAGPLLVQHGRAAFEPEIEGFARGVRILDEATQQAALGVRPDGTVLFVVAEKMVAEDLVPVFLGLGAEAALRLDSGSSATLVAGGRTVNRLLTRRVESAIVAVPSADAGLGR